MEGRKGIKGKRGCEGSKSVEEKEWQREEVNDEMERGACKD